MSPSQAMATMDAPVSSSMGAIGPLLRKLNLLLAPEYPLRRSVKQAIELLKEDFGEVSAALVEQSMVDSPSNKAKYWMDEVRDLSYYMEDCIDHMIRLHSVTDGKVRSIHNFKICRIKIDRFPKMLKLPSRISRIVELRTLLREASERYERYQLDDDGAIDPMLVFSGHNQVPALYKAAIDLVGVEDLRKELTEWLKNREEKQLKVLSLVGPAGTGKTTLIRALYGELKGQFECRAFIRLSRKPDMSKLLEKILSQVQGPKQTSDGSVLQNSIDSIREHLQDKRYFIFIDDLWDATQWEIINNAFPKGNNCSSRIIITAEFQDVLAECNGYQSVITCFEMKPLGSSDSEKLFLRRVFGHDKHNCPDQLKELSWRIIMTCGGLPLAIIMMAGLLASERDNTDLPNQLLQCFLPSLAILTLEEKLEKIVNLCYNSLPQYLKTCLLYLNIYPEGSTILKVDLLKQWIAEGFVNPTEAKEGVLAESYFDELVSRGMIQPEKINHNDEVLSFTVHHVVFTLISHKSREENFVTAVDYSQTITGLPMKVHRLSLHFSSATNASKPEGIRQSQIRSFTFFGLHRCMPSIIEFKHLRVLNLELWGDYDDCLILNLSGLCRLFLLRYMKVSSHISVELPSQIQGLQFLETLEIDAKVLDTPNDLFYLPSLLHLSLRSGTKLPDGIGRVTSLQTLQCFDIGNNSEDNTRSLGELINLQDLRLTCSEAPSDEHLKRNLVALSYSLGRLGNLRSLTMAPGIVGAPGPRAMAVLQTAMEWLEEEFRRLLCEDTTSYRYWMSPNWISPKTVRTLRGIADVMLCAGYAPKLCQVYGEVRYNRLMKCVPRFGFDMKSLSYKLNEFFRRHLSEERRICNQILASDAKAAEACFTEVATGCVLKLLKVVDVTNTVKISPDKLFPTLDAYKALSEVLLELEGLFSGEAMDLIKVEIEETVARLGNAVRAMVAELSRTIQGESSQIPLFDGGIHPLIPYFMNYVQRLAAYNALLNTLLEYFYTDKTDMTPLEQCVLELITHLQGMIQEKSRLYEDEALQNVFLMNNLLYIVQEVKDSELKTLLGDNWISRHRSQIKQCSEGYVRSSLTRVLTFLRDDWLLQIKGSSSAPVAALKDRLNNFNLAFEEMYRTQTAWRVVDPQLREELKTSISENILPAYQSFVVRFQGQLEGGGSSPEYIKYNPDDLETMISHLFEGRES